MLSILASFTVFSIGASALLLGDCWRPTDPEPSRALSTFSAAFVAAMIASPTAAALALTAHTASCVSADVDRSDLAEPCTQPGDRTLLGSSAPGTSGDGCVCDRLDRLTRQIGILLPWATTVPLFVSNLAIIGGGPGRAIRGNFYSRPTSDLLATLNGIHLLISASARLATDD